MNVNDFKCQIHDNLDFPVGTKLYARKNDDISSTHLHWHEYLELIYILKGTANITINVDEYTVHKNEIICINSSNMHAVTPNDDCVYHSITIGKMLCNRYDLSMDELYFKEVITDDDISECFSMVAEEIMLEKTFYQQRVQALILEILVTMSRKYTNIIKLPGNKNIKQIELIKKSVLYINKHYREKISVDDICQYVGYSKNYFCRTFKDITGRTAIEYVNILRCNYAHRLITSGKYNVSESAILSGYTNFSYFSRTYKRILGQCPSLENK